MVLSDLLLWRRKIITRMHSELDLSDRAATREFFMAHRPDHVVMCAAKVGGILANLSLPVDFLHINLAIQLSVFEAAHAAGIDRMIFLGSSCIYPRGPQSIREDYLLTGRCNQCRGLGCRWVRSLKCERLGAHVVGIDGIYRDGLKYV